VRHPIPALHSSRIDPELLPSPGIHAPAAPLPRRPSAAPPLCRANPRSPAQQTCTVVNRRCWASIHSGQEYDPEHMALTPLDRPEDTEKL